MTEKEIAKQYADSRVEDIRKLLEEAFIAGCEFAKKKGLKYDNKIYYDLDLPSGTLWSFPDYYEHYGFHLDTCTYEKAILLNLPTEEQWQELCAHCKVHNYVLKSPNGKEIGYPTRYTESGWPKMVYSLGEKCTEGQNKFWLKAEPDKKHQVKVILFDKGVATTSTHFTGYRLPFFLVKNKEEI